MEDILIVGAGAVGATYGYPLHKGGARVSFYVREKYKAEVEAGVTVIPKAKDPVSFVPDAVLTEPGEIAGRAFTQVWLTMSSPALQGDWRVPLLEATGEATIVALQPGIGDHELIAETVGEDRVVSGLITFAAWHSPLEGEGPGPEGYAYVIPPLGKQPFSGPGAPRVVEALKAGGMAAAVVEDARRQGAIGSSAMNPMIASLEVAGWSLADWTTLPLGARAAQQALASVDGGVPAPLKIGLRAPLMRLALPFAKMWFPVDLETYVRVHFTKVGDQTLSSLGRLGDRGRAAGVPVDALEELHELLVASRSR